MRKGNLRILVYILFMGVGIGCSALGLHLGSQIHSLDLSQPITPSGPIPLWFHYTIASWIFFTGGMVITGLSFLSIILASLEKFGIKID